MDFHALDFITGRIPHRPPFLWLDRVLELTGESIRAEKTIPADLDIFKGHYPDYPLMPGVLLCEAVFQAGALLVGELLKGEQEYLNDLVLQGDDLKGLRKVNHWLYFPGVNLRNAAGKRLKELNFSLDAIAYKKESKTPYELKISRHDSISPDSIDRLTTFLRVLCASQKGQYDGWSTEVKGIE